MVDVAVRTGRRIVRRLLRDDCQIWRQNEAGVYVLSSTLKCAKIVDVDPTPGGVDPADMSDRELTASTFHFRYGANVLEDDEIVFVPDSQRFNAAEVVEGTFSATKAVRGSRPIYLGLMYDLVLLRKTGSSGARVRLPAQRVRRILKDPTDLPTVEAGTVNRTRSGIFIKVAPFDVQAGDTYLSPEGLPGRVTDVHPGQRSFVEARFEEFA